MVKNLLLPLEAELFMKKFKAVQGITGCFHSRETFL